MSARCVCALQWYEECSVNLKKETVDNETTALALHILYVTHSAIPKHSQNLKHWKALAVFVPSEVKLTK